MANLSVTNSCNRNCPYCFANDTLTEFGKTFMDDNTYEKALGYLERSGLLQVRLLGGEPTLHPHFISFVNRALEKELDIMLFTNGLFTDHTLDFLTSLPEKRLSILLNTIHPSELDLPGIERQKKMMTRLGKVIIPGINIYHSRQDLNYLLGYVTDYNLKKEIRLGISHSVLSGKNVFLHPKEYHKIGYNIALLKQKALEENIALGFDCGFVPCMFPEEFIDLLTEELKKAGNCCHPIIDLLTDGSFIACYPLNNFLKIKLDDNLDASSLINHFEEAIKPYKEIGIYPYCTTCPLFNNRCNGGCMSFRIQRYSNQTDYYNKSHDASDDALTGIQKR
jgi:MoaA/NifB/PqqE/SkfB family radical SAM enzyme